MDKYNYTNLQSQIKYVIYNRSKQETPLAIKLKGSVREYYSDRG